MTQPKTNEEIEEEDAFLRGAYGIPFQDELESMSDLELAELQSKLDNNSPGSKIIENEWHRRNILTTQNLTTQKTNKEPPHRNKQQEWYKRPIGIIGLTVFAGVIVALVLYLIKTHLGINL